MKIAVIGLAPLSALGMRLVCDGLGWPDCDVFTTGAEALAARPNYDMLVASADAVALEPHFFMPRRQRLVIVTSHVDAAAPVPPQTIVPSMGEEEIGEVLLALAGSFVSTEPDPHETLSSREAEVLREVAAGKTNKEIADALCISINTVITHRKNISAKLGVRSASGFSRYAMMNGLVEGVNECPHHRQISTEGHE